MHSSKLNHKYLNKDCIKYKEDKRVITHTNKIQQKLCKLNTTIVTSWTSPVHGTDTGVAYFLMYDGSTIEWKTTTSLDDTVAGDLLTYFLSWMI